MNYQSSSYSDNIQKVIKNASKFALRFGSNLIGSEHILYGIASVKDCLSAQFLADVGVTEANLFAFFEENVSEEDIFGISGVVEMTPRTKDLFRMAQQFALQMGHSFLGTEHLLLALLHSTGSVAYRILVGQYDVDIDALKNKIVSAIKIPERKEEGKSTQNKQQNSKPWEMGRIYF